MVKKTTFASITVSAGFLAIGALGPVAWTAAPAQSVQAGIEEVLVTARRREESLQDVPIAISAFGGENLEQRGIERVENMNAVAPNLSVMGGVNTGESQASFRVRGMPGVAVYVDGVNQPTTDGLLTMSVVEVDRIEVLRGPQGTLFGNASLGGAVHYVTRAPGEAFGGRVRGNIGSFNRRDIQAAVDLPLSDTFKTKFTAASQSRDGFVQSRLVDIAYGDINDELFRADFLWEPLDSVSVRYNYEVSNTKRNGPGRVTEELEPTGIVTIGGLPVNTYPQGQIYANIGVPYNPENQVSGFPGGVVGLHETNVAWVAPGLLIDQDRHTLDINWDINDTFRVRSISGYKELERYTQTDLDGTSQTTVLDVETGARLYSFGQELQILGSHERVDWVLGGYFEQQYNRTRTNTRALAEFTCDLWDPADRTNRGVTDQDRANCFNLRAQALRVNNPALVATPNNIPANSALAAAVNPNTNGGLYMSQFTGAVASNSDPLQIQRPESQAVFGDLTWRATDQLTIAAGLRYSKDESDGQITIGTGNNRSLLINHAGQFLDGANQDLFAFRNNLPAPSNPTDFDALTKRLTVQYQWTPDFMTYVSYSDGYQPGGVSLLNNVLPGMLTISPTTGQATGGYLRDIYNSGRSDVPLVITRDEQTVKSYEIGMRADWMGGALRTNLTVFYTDWQNVPVNQYPATSWWDTDGNGFADSQVDITGDGLPDPFYLPSLFTTAVDKAEASGLELEAIWRATDNLRIDLNVGYLKTEYKELGIAATGVVPALQQGTPFAGAPEFTVNVSGQYEFGFSGGAALVPRVDYTFTDDYTLNTGEQNQRIQEGFGLLNARLTYDPGTNWTVALTGSNLTDEWYMNSGLYSRADRVNFVTIGRPREWGLQFDFRFE